MMMMQLSVLVTWLLLVCYQYCSSINAHQINSLNKLINSRRSQKPPNPQPWVGLDEKMKMIMHDHHHDHGVYTANQYGLKEADKIDALPGKPHDEVDFDQYSGYVTVDPKAGKALFYYFVESPQNSSAKPLILWLNGGPGCSSLGYGAMQEVGPFRVSSEGKTLVPNKYAWNNVANVIFLESPAGVGFSYSNTTSDYTNTGDKSTAEDSYTFLVNWLERFPNYKTRDLFLAGESYAGHYIPQLAYTILSNNQSPSQTKVNLKGIAIGNAWVDENIGVLGIYDYLWAHALNSDETNAGIHKYCDSVSGNSNSSSKCDQYQSQGFDELGNIDLYNVYAPLCNDSAASIGSVKDFDPCSDIYVNEYLNLGEVQKALHVKATHWSACSNVGWMDSPITILPIIKQLVDRGISVWMYSGDTDGRVPVTSTRYAINTFKLPVETSWRSWYSNSEVGGYLVGYKGLTLITVRGAGHMVPSYQPQRALTMISYFLQGKLPPSS